MKPFKGTPPSSGGKGSSPFPPGSSLPARPSARRAAGARGSCGIPPPPQAPRPAGGFSCAARWPRRQPVTASRKTGYGFRDAVRNGGGFPAVPCAPCRCRPPGSRPPEKSSSKTLSRSLRARAGTPTPRCAALSISWPIRARAEAHWADAELHASRPVRAGSARSGLPRAAAFRRIPRVPRTSGDRRPCADAAQVAAPARGAGPHHAEPQGMPYFLSFAYSVERLILSSVSAPSGPRTRPSVRSMMRRR